VLLNPQEHEKTILHITGPTALSNNEIAAVLSEVTGKPIKHVSLPFPEYFATVKDSTPQWFWPFLEAYENHAVEGHAQLVNSTFFKLTGKQPTPIKAVFEANKTAIMLPK